MLDVDTLGIYLEQIFISVIISRYGKWMLLKDIVDIC